MREHPLIFSPEMVRGILAGKKSQTRRVVRHSNSSVNGENVRENNSLWSGLVWNGREKEVFVDRGYYNINPANSQYLHVPWKHPAEEFCDAVYRVRCRYEIGDLLWVKEPWGEQWREVFYQADWPKAKTVDWKSAMFMPRRLSRLTLEITNIRVQRIQEISEADAVAEGCSTRDDFIALWNSLAKKGNDWGANCWVWVLEYKRVEEPLQG